LNADAWKALIALVGLTAALGFWAADAIPEVLKGRSVREYWHDRAQAKRLRSIVRIELEEWEARTTPASPATLRTPTKKRKAE
jgi:hypothetical protein